MKLSVQKYTSEFYDEMIRFNESIYKNRLYVREQVIYKLSANNEDTLIALDDEKIVGQFFLLKAGFFYKGKLQDCYFGCDYIVDETHRNTAIGIKLLNKTIKEQLHIGIGLSDISKKMHLRLKEKLVGSIDKYLYVKNVMTYFYIASKSYLKLTLRPRKVIKIGPEKFSVNGYNITMQKEIPAFNTSWNNDLIEISRTSNYNYWRFGSMLKDKYETYSISNKNGLVEGYFIVRSEYWRGVNILLVVDYRCNLRHSEILTCICEASKIIMKHKSLDAILFGSSLKIVDEVLVNKNFKKVGVPSEIVTNIKMDETDLQQAIDTRSLIFVTPADSDFEYNLGTNIWQNL